MSWPAPSAGGTVRHNLLGGGNDMHIKDVWQLKFALSPARVLFHVSFLKYPQYSFTFNLGDFPTSKCQSGLLNTLVAAFIFLHRTNFNRA